MAPVIVTLTSFELNWVLAVSLQALLASIFVSITKVPFFEELLARHCAKCFTFIISFNLHNSPLSLYRDFSEEEKGKQVCLTPNQRHCS